MKNRIREIRFNQKKTLGDLWLATKINQPKLSQIEREIFEPTEEEIKKISTALRVPIKEVFSEA